LVDEKNCIPTLGAHWEDDGVTKERARARARGYLHYGLSNAESDKQHHLPHKEFWKYSFYSDAQGEDRGNRRTYLDLLGKGKTPFVPRSLQREIWESPVVG
jgi:hypothetical protein